MNQRQGQRGLASNRGIDTLLAHQPEGDHQKAISLLTSIDNSQIFASHASEIDHEQREACFSTQKLAQSNQASCQKAQKLQNQGQSRLTPRDDHHSQLMMQQQQQNIFGSMQHSAIKPPATANQSNLLEETIMSIVEKCVSQQFEHFQKAGQVSPFKTGLPAAESSSFTDLSLRSKMAMANQHCNSENTFSQSQLQSELQTIEKSPPPQQVQPQKSSQFLHEEDLCKNIAEVFKRHPSLLQLQSVSQSKTMADKAVTKKQVSGSKAANAQQSSGKRKRRSSVNSGNKSQSLLMKQQVRQYSSGKGQGGLSQRNHKSFDRLPEATQQVSQMNAPLVSAWPHVRNKPTHSQSQRDLMSLQTSYLQQFPTHSPQQNEQRQASLQRKHERLIEGLQVRAPRELQEAARGVDLAQPIRLDLFHCDQHPSNGNLASTPLENSNRTTMAQSARRSSQAPQQPLPAVANPTIASLSSALKQTPTRYQYTTQQQQQHHQQSILTQTATPKSSVVSLPPPVPTAAENISITALNLQNHSRDLVRRHTSRGSLGVPSSAAMLQQTGSSMMAASAFDGYGPSQLTQQYAQAARALQEPQIIPMKVESPSQTELAAHDIFKLSEKVKKLEQQLIAENEANDDLTEQLDQAYKTGYKTRQDNTTKQEENQRLQSKIEELQQQVKQLQEDNQKKNDGCESCIDYIKQMKRMEFDLQVEREARNAFEKEVKMLQQKLSEIEEEDRDRVDMSMSYSEREYAYIRELERVRSQNNMNMMIIQKLSVERRQENEDILRNECQLTPDPSK